MSESICAAPGNKKVSTDKILKHSRLVFAKIREFSDRGMSVAKDITTEVEFVSEISLGKLDKPLIDCLKLLDGVLGALENKSIFTESLYDNKEELGNEAGKKGNKEGTGKGSDNEWKGDDDELFVLFNETNSLGKEISKQRNEVYGVCRRIDDSIERSKHFLNSFNNSEISNMSMSFKDDNIRIY